MNPSNSMKTNPISPLKLLRAQSSLDGQSLSPCSRKLIKFSTSFMSIFLALAVVLVSMPQRAAFADVVNSDGTPFNSKDDEANVAANADKDKYIGFAPLVGAIIIIFVLFSGGYPGPDDSSESTPGGTVKESLIQSLKDLLENGGGTYDAPTLDFWGTEFAEKFIIQAGGYGKTVVWNPGDISSNPGGDDNGGEIVVGHSVVVDKLARSGGGVGSVGLGTFILEGSSGNLQGAFSAWIKSGSGNGAGSGNGNEGGGNGHVWKVNHLSGFKPDGSDGTGQLIHPKANPGLLNLMNGKRPLSAPHP